MKLSQIVKTKIGLGVYQGRVDTHDAHGAPGDELALVRLPVNEETSRHLQDSNCVTPHAEKSALFVFHFSEVGEG